MASYISALPQFAVNTKGDPKTFPDMSTAEVRSSMAIHPDSQTNKQEGKQTGNHLGKRAIVLLGSTGSIGQSAIKVLLASPDSFFVLGLAGGKNIERLAQQANVFQAPYLAVQDEDDIGKLRSLLATSPSYNPLILHGQEGYETLASLDQATIVLSAQSGAAGLRGTLAAVKAGKVIALANKESLVIAGELIRHLCASSGASILPVDSEHNAIFQCLQGNDMADVQRLILTASGGPFVGWSKEKLTSVTKDMALKHPNWDMGAKISIDSATLMNKGLEIIEACHLYGVPLSQVDVVIHRQSIIHSLVEFIDGSQLAQMGTQDMRSAIGHCLHWPLRRDSGVQKLHLSGALTFEEPDTEAFPCLSLAREALKQGLGYPAILNAANEIAVEAFLREAIAFLDIPRIVDSVLQTCQGQCDPLNIDELLALDQEARTQAKQRAYT